MKTLTQLPLLLLLLFCTKATIKKKVPQISIETNDLQKDSKFKDYWYQGKAEITSYKLTQARYGGIYKGTAVNIFVTEDFLPEKQVKADAKNKANIPILKLNSTKKFVTGIYPYSLMTSTFSPIDRNKKALKISFSAQEWCGNTFVQLNHKEDFKIDVHSYFESNADRKITLKKSVLENDFWNLLRVDPYKIKKGGYKVIPSFEFLAMQHQKIKEYTAEVQWVEKGAFIYFSVDYPTLKRKITIKLTKQFPFTIEGWEETFTKRGKKQTTKAEKIKTIQSAYWTKNGVLDSKERIALGL